MTDICMVAANNIRQQLATPADLLRSGTAIWLMQHFETSSCDTALPATAHY